MRRSSWCRLRCNGRDWMSREKGGNKGRDVGLEVLSEGEVRQSA